MMFLKESLKKWIKETLRWINLKLDKEVEDVNNFDILLAEYREDQFEYIISKRGEASKSMWSNLFLKDTLLM